MRAVGFLDWLSGGPSAQQILDQITLVKAGQARIEANQNTIIINQRIIMALVSVDQSVLDAIGSTLNDIADAVQTIVDDDSNDLGPADLAPITNPVTRLQDILTKPEEPVDGGDGSGDVPPADDSGVQE